MSSSPHSWLLSVKLSYCRSCNTGKFCQCYVLHFLNFDTHCRIHLSMLVSGLQISQNCGTFKLRSRGVLLRTYESISFSACTELFSRSFRGFASSRRGQSQASHFFFLISLHLQKNPDTWVAKIILPKKSSRLQARSSRMTGCLCHNDQSHAETIERETISWQVLSPYQSVGLNVSSTCILQWLPALSAWCKGLVGNA